MTIWNSVLKDVDDFGDPLNEEFIDGKTVYGPWGIMTPKSWELHGVGRLGIGRGQRYQRREDGKYVCVEGGYSNVR